MFIYKIYMLFSGIYMVVKTKLLALTILLLITLSSILSFATPIVVRKSIIRKTTVSADGTLSTEVNVFIVLEGEGTVTIKDITALIVSENIIADPEASSVNLEDEKIVVTWENVNLAKQNILKYKVQGRSLFMASINIMVNGEPVEPDCKDGYCIIYYENAKNITYSFTLTVIASELKNQPLPIIISWRIDPSYLYPVSFSEKPSSMRESGNEVAFSWSGSINNTYSLNVTFSIRRENPWGEIYLSSPIVTISLDPRMQEKMAEEILRIIESKLEQSTGGLEGALENMSKLQEVLLNLSVMLENQSKLLMEASEEASKGSKALSNAALQLKRIYNDVNDLRDLAEKLSNTREVDLNKAEYYIDQALANFDEIEQVIREVAPSLNLSTDEMISSVKERLIEAKNLISSMKNQVKDIQSLSYKLDKSLNTFSAFIDRLDEAAKSMADLSVMLKDASEGFMEISQQMKTAANYISVNIELFSNKEIWMNYSEGFEWLNETFHSEKVKIYGVDSYNSELFGDMVEVSLPDIKVKRTPTNLKYVTEAPSKRKVSGLNPIIFALLLLPMLAFTIYHLNNPRKIDEKEEKLLEKISMLEEKLSSISSH